MSRSSSFPDSLHSSVVLPLLQVCLVPLLSWILLKEALRAGTHGACLVSSHAEEQTHKRTQQRLIFFKRNERG